MYWRLSSISICVVSIQQLLLFWISISQAFINAKRENWIGAKNRSCIWPTLAHWEALWQIQNLLNTFKRVCSCSFRHLKRNFKNLFGIESTSDLTLQLLSSVNNEFFFVIGVGREIECIGATESTDILYVCVRVTCKIKLNIEENFKIWMLMK